MGVFLPSPQQHRVGSVETTHPAAQFFLLCLPLIFLALPLLRSPLLSPAPLPSLLLLFTFQSLDLGGHRGWDSMTPAGLSGMFLSDPKSGALGPICQGIWDLSLLTRDQTRLLAVKAQSPNHWAT